MQIARDFYLNKLINHMHNDMIKIVSGIRRCGKSYLLNTIFTEYLEKQGVKKENIISIPLDDYAFKELQNPKNCYQYVKNKIKNQNMYYILIDEVQLMDDFESVLNGFLHIKNVDVYVSGSNSKFLSSDVITEFRGRGDEIKVYPLSFLEFYTALHTDFETAFSLYAQFGGMPNLFKLKSNIEKINYLKNLFQETYLKDIIDHNKIKNTAELESLVNIMASNIGGLTNPSKIMHTFKTLQKTELSIPTINQYLEYLEDAFLMQKVNRFDVKGKKYINSPFKYYFTDIGLRNARLNFRQIEMPHILENIVYNELLKQGYAIDIGIIESWKNQSHSNLEIDFVVNNIDKRYYVQVAFDLPNESKINQELNSLLSIKDSFKKVVITPHILNTHYTENGILMLKLQDFLLNPILLEQY